MQFAEILLSWIRFILGLLSLNSMRIELWISQPANNVFLARSSDLTFSSTPSAPTTYTINVNEGVKYQQIDGFGGSMTDASAWLLFYHLTPIKRIEIMRKLFSSDGINLSLLRQPMGATDFAWSQYSFDDLANNMDDFNLTAFSLWREDAYIRPMLNQALNVNPGRIKLFASPWSPPAWMKTNRSMIGTLGEKILDPSPSFLSRNDRFEKYVINE